MTVSFWVHGIPETKGSWKFIKGRKRPIPDNPRAEAWEQAVAWCARLAVNRQSWTVPATQHVYVEMWALLPPPIGRKNERDVDKLARAALDAMQGIVYANDKQVADLWVRRIYRVGAPGMFVHVALSETSDEMLAALALLTELPK